MIDNRTEQHAGLAHPTADAIESYALASVRERLDADSPEVIRIEEHLLWCHSCLESVEQEESLALVIKEQLAAMKARRAKRAKPKVLHAGQYSSRYA